MQYSQATNQTHILSPSKQQNNSPIKGKVTYSRKKVSLNNPELVGNQNQSSGKNLKPSEIAEKSNVESTVKYSLIQARLAQTQFQLKKINQDMATLQFNNSQNIQKITKKHAAELQAIKNKLVSEVSINQEAMVKFQIKCQQQAKTILHQKQKVWAACVQQLKLKLSMLHSQKQAEVNNLYIQIAQQRSKHEKQLLNNKTEFLKAWQNQKQYLISSHQQNVNNLKQKYLSQLNNLAAIRKCQQQRAQQKLQEVQKEKDCLQQKNSHLNKTIDKMKSQIKLYVQKEREGKQMIDALKLQMDQATQSSHYAQQLIQNGWVETIKQLKYQHSQEIANLKNKYQHKYSEIQQKVQQLDTIRLQETHMLHQSLFLLQQKFKKRPSKPEDSTLIAGLTQQVQSHKEQIKRLEDKCIQMQRQAQNNEIMYSKVFNKKAKTIDFVSRGGSTVDVKYMIAFGEKISARSRKN